MPEEVKEEVAQEVAADVGSPNLAQILAVFPGSPTQQELESWKQLHGEIMCSGFSETELFIWRALNRSDYVSLQKKMRTPPEEGKEPLNEFDYEEMVVKTCLLWASIPDISKKAGSVSTLSEQILMNSNFMPPQVAAQFVIRL
jgi:hypothetical protein